MPEPWAEFVAEAIHGSPDDPYVRMLKERLADGSRLVRVQFLPAEVGRAAEYRLVLEKSGQLFETRVPHTPSFMQWSFDNRAQLATPEEEAARFAVLLQERMEPLERRTDSDLLHGVLFDLVRSLGPTRAQALVTTNDAPRRRNNDAARVETQVRAVLHDLARSLGVGLGYSSVDASSILDQALARYLGHRAHVAPDEHIPEHLPSPG